eukprot:COSAG06_NODE_11428_length_1512_cov_1.106865_1_plen_364_part_10
MPIPEASETRPRRQPHEIVAAQKLSAGRQVAKMEQRAAAAEQTADSTIASGQQKVVASDKAQVGRLYAAAAKKENAGGLAAGKLTSLMAEAHKAEQDFLNVNAGNDKAANFIIACKQLLCGSGELGELKGKTFYNFVCAIHNKEKAQRKVDKGVKATQLADLSAGVIQRKIERRRGAAKTVQQRVQAAKEKLAAHGKEDTDEGDQQAADALFEAFFAKKAAGAGDIALYLKRMFNEDTEPDDDDIACLAGFLSTALEDSEEEDDDADEGLAAAEDAAKQAQDARVKKLQSDQGQPEKPEQSEKPEKPVFEELPPGLYMADLLQDERVQAVIRELALVSGKETEHQVEPEPYVENVDAGSSVVA